MSSGYRLNESQASPLTSTQFDVGSCSMTHQSLLTLPPSIWWAAVAVPHRNPSGKLIWEAIASSFALTAIHPIRRTADVPMGSNEAADVHPGWTQHLYDR